MFYAIASTIIVFVPKYRYRVLKGDIGKFVYESIYAHMERSGCEVVELNVQPDHVHLLVKVQPKGSRKNNFTFWYLIFRSFSAYFKEQKL